MRFLLPSLVVFSVGTGLIAAPTPKEKEKVKDEDSILGTWAIEKFDTGGGPPPPIDVTQIRFTFKKDGKMAMTGGPNGESREGDYKLDPSTKPKSIDLIHEGRTAPGIYELDGDTFKLCMTEGQNAVRPEEFKPDGKRMVVVTFKRVKEEKKEEKKDK